MTNPNLNQTHEYIEELVTPDLEEEKVATAIKWLKNNKAADFNNLPAELFKVGGDALNKCMHQLLPNIWSQECIPSDWNVSVLCPFLKKGDAAVCTNYRGISLLNVAYKILSNVLCERLKPYVEKLIGSY